MKRERGSSSRVGSRGLVIALLAFAPRLQADNQIPVYVSVTGGGQIRVFLTAGN